MKYIEKVGSFIDENDVVYPASLDCNAGLGLVPDLECGVEFTDLSDEFLELLRA
jgi:hypothetical protein